MPTIAIKRHQQDGDRQRFPVRRVLRGESQRQAAQHGQAEMLYQRKRERPEFGFQADLGFERGFEKFQRGQFPRADAQGFQIQHLNGGGQRHQNRHDGVQDQEEQRHRFAFLAWERSISPSGNPSRLRQRLSARAISPESVS